MRAAGLTRAAAAFLLAASAVGQQEPKAPASPEQPGWEFSASAYAYFVPHERDYALPTVTADRDWLHLEARYNYEGLNTGSAWFGATFNWGKTLTLELTPMVGGVFGHTNGVAPGYHLTLGYKRFELYSEGEYLFDTDHSADSFFYNWSELTYAPVEWLRAGLVVQRTRAYQTPLDIQRGLLVGASLKSWKFTLYLFNLGWTDPTTVFSISLEF
jgi:hypothetical protein